MAERKPGAKAPAAKEAPAKRGAKRPGGADPDFGAMHVSAAAIGSLIGLSMRSVRELTLEGVLTPRMDGNRRRYCVLESMNAYVAHLKRERGKPGALADSQRRERAEADWKAAKARKAELELAAYRGELLDRKAVEWGIDDMQTRFAARVDAMPARLAPLIAGGGGMEDALRLLRAEARDIRLELMGYGGETKKRAGRRPARTGGGEGEGDGDDPREGGD
jgi:phage terminase Nu1 subunit (DNA packaging protein)